MTWDEDYKREVLEPARAAGDQPPEDLRLRYQLTDPLMPADVAARVKQVRQCWRRARGQLKYRKLIDRLEAEHRELASVFTAAERGDLAPLKARLAFGAERLAQRRAEVRGRLLDAAGAVRMLTPGDLAGIARSGGVTAAELAWLAKAEGIEVREPDPLPVVPPYAGYARAREALDVLGHRHLAHFLFGERLTGPIRVLHGFGMVPPDPGAPALLLDSTAVGRAAAEWARRARDTSTTAAETVLIALKSADPAELLRYDVAERLRERHRQRASEQALLHHAIQGLGIEAGDARRLVFAVRREDGPAGGAAGRLRELLDGGNVHAAAELATTITGAVEPGDSLDGDAAVLAAEARQRVATAAGLRAQAAAEPDPDVAWRLLTDALHLVPDLPGAEEHLRRLPPRPVPAVHAELTGDTVLLTWQLAASTGGEIGYRVLRRAGGPPGSGDESLATTVEGSFRDAAPPVNVPLYYGVAARRGDAAAPPAVTGPVVVRPEPAGIELTAGDGAVTGRWSLPRESAGVLLTRTDGESGGEPVGKLGGKLGGRPGGEPGRHRASTPIRSDRLGFTDHDVHNGAAYHYRISAVYLDDQGREVVTRGIMASVTPNAPPDPITSLTIEPDPLDPGRLLLLFEPARHGIPEVVLLPGPPPWPQGALIPAAAVRSVGRPLPATPAASRGSSTGTGLAVRTRGPGVLLVVTVAGQLAAIGAHRRHLSLPPPRELVAQRRAGSLHVGFDWPAEVTEVEVAYRTSGAAERTRLTRAGYDAAGGVQLAVPEGETVELAVAACAGSVVGSPTTLIVAGHRVVEYDLARTGPRWRRSLVLTLSADQPVRVAGLRLVLRPGKVMPTRPEDGETLACWTDLDVVGSLRLTLPEPKRAQPYWLRCFAEDETLDLADPPIRRLQVT